MKKHAILYEYNNTTIFGDEFGTISAIDKSELEKKYNTLISSDITVVDMRENEYSIPGIDIKEVDREILEKVKRSKHQDSNRPIFKILTHNKYEHWIVASIDLNEKLWIIWTVMIFLSK